MQDPNGSIVAVVRIVFSDMPNGMSLPSGYANWINTCNSLPSSNTINDTVAEYSGIWFHEVEYILALYILGAYWIDEHYPKTNLIALYDNRNKNAMALYLKAFGFDRIKNLKAVYDGYCYKESNAPVEWSLALDNFTSRSERINHIFKQTQISRIINLTTVSGAKI